MSKTRAQEVVDKYFKDKLYTVSVKIPFTNVVKKFTFKLPSEYDLCAYAGACSYIGALYKAVKAFYHIYKKDAGKAIIDAVWMFTLLLDYALFHGSKNDLELKLHDAEIEGIKEVLEALKSGKVKPEDIVIEQIL